MMGNIRLTVAMSDYDHVRDFMSGRIRAEGIEITHLRLVIQEIFYRFSNALEWDVSEMSLGKYCSFVSAGDPAMVAIPVFPCRMFRHSSIYVHRDSPISGPEDLVGKRIGVPEWSQTATIWIRGWLVNDVGISLNAIDWFQAGGDQAGRLEMGHVHPPPGVRVTPILDRSMTDMILTGDLDAMINAQPPKLFVDGDPRLRRLIPNYRAAEEQYFASTGLFPIMHTVVIRRDVFERNRWVAMNLLEAFEVAKNNSVERALDLSVPGFPVPWQAEHTQAVSRTIFGAGQYWPYGIDANRKVLEAFLSYCKQQGVTNRLLSVDDLFPIEVRSRYRV